MYRVSVILTDTEQAASVGRELRDLCERAVRETLELEGRRLAGLVGGHGRERAESDREVEVSVTLTDERTIRDLNRRYLGRDRATDVLAFFMGDADDEPGPGPAAAPPDAGAGAAPPGPGPVEGAPPAPGPGVPPSEPYLLGDIVVSVDAARSQAAEYRRPFAEELARLVTHGTLHLLDYTDDSPESAEVMHAKEDAVLTVLGFHPDAP